MGVLDLMLFDYGCRFDEFVMVIGFVVCVILLCCDICGLMVVDSVVWMVDVFV